MISYLGSLVQFSPAAGRAGRCRQITLCMESTRRVPATLGLPRTGVSVGVCAFPVYTAQAPGCSIWSGPCTECGSSFRVLHKSLDSVVPAFCAFPGLSGSGSQGLGRTLPGCGTPFPSAAPARPAQSGLRKSLERNRGLFAGWEGVASLGLSLPLSPPLCLLPPSGMGRLFSGVSQSLCFANRRQCVRAG